MLSKCNAFSDYGSSCIIVDCFAYIDWRAKTKWKSLGIWAFICLFAMFAGAIGSNVLPKSMFGIAERVSTFSAVVFNAVLGMYLFLKKFDN